MLKYILFVAITIPLAFYAWEKYHAETPVEQVETPNKSEQNNIAETFKDENLHKAFAKILSVEKNKKRKLTVDELIEAYYENKIKLTLEEIRLINAKLTDDISKNEKEYAIAGAEGHSVEELESIVSIKREQLENFKQMESQLAGVEIEK